MAGPVRGGPSRGGMRGRGGPRFAAPQTRFAAPASSGAQMFAAPPMPTIPQNQPPI